MSPSLSSLNDSRESRSISHIQPPVLNGGKNIYFLTQKSLPLIGNRLKPIRTHEQINFFYLFTQNIKHQ